MILENSNKNNSIWEIVGNDVVIPGTRQNEQALYNTLPNAIYEVEFNDRIGFYLRKVHDVFTFNYKVYGLKTDFIDRVIKTYAETNGYFGLLFNGIKGTGKTVLAKKICNSLGNPVILVNDDHDGTVVDFLAKSFKQDVTIMIDEYEKVFDYKSQEKLLTLMDGVLTDNKYRKTFIMTTNETRINENLIDRCSRIRYILEFGDLTESEIREVVDDMLSTDCLEFKEELIELVKTLKIITIDNIKQLTSELNIHKISPNILIQEMNISRAGARYNIHLVEDGKQRLIKRNYNSYDTPVVSVGTMLYGVGEVVSINDNGTLNVNISRFYDDYLVVDECKKIDKFLNKHSLSSYASFDEICDKVGDDDSNILIKEIKLEKCAQTHKSFKDESQSLYL